MSGSTWFPASEQPAPAPPEATDGLRTERVVLEIKHGEPFGVSQWSWVTILRLQSDESVRVVEEAHFDDLAQVAMERDAAIRERDTLRAERITQALTADRFAAAVQEVDMLRARVAELEAAGGEPISKPVQEIVAERIAEVLLRKDGLYETVNRLEAMSQDPGRTVEWEEFNDQGENSDGVAQSPVVAVPAAGDLCGDEAGSGEVAGRLTQAASGGVESIGRKLAERFRRFADRLESGERDMPSGLPTAASGGGEGEPVAISPAERDGLQVIVDGVVRHGNGFVVVPGSDSLRAVESVLARHTTAPPQPRGWLTQEERALVQSWERHYTQGAHYAQSPSHTNDIAAEMGKLAEVCRAFLARSSPPEVVLESWREAAGEVVSLDDVRAALAAIGVVVKEVGRE
jgi:hypothetical protein